MSIMNEIDPCLLLSVCILYEIQNQIFQHIRGPNVFEIFVCLNAINGLKILEVGNDNGVLFGFSENHEPRIYRSLKLKSIVD